MSLPMPPQLDDEPCSPGPTQAFFTAMFLFHNGLPHPAKELHREYVSLKTIAITKATAILAQLLVDRPHCTDPGDNKDTGISNRCTTSSCKIL